MSEPITADQMRALEEAAISSGRVTGLELMERAGRGVVAAVVDHWPDLASGPHRAAVLCGPGNNGGDGFVVARLLREAGWEVSVWFYGNKERLPPDARTNHDRWAVSERVVSLSFPEVAPAEAREFAAEAYDVTDTLIVDALFGIGLNRPIDGLRPLLRIHERHRDDGDGSPAARHVAIDLPSGLGEAGPVTSGPATCFSAALTVTFHRLKTAHLAGAAFCGKIVVADIGL